MEKFNSTDEILDYAINAEQEAINFYSNLYNRTSNANMKLAYREFIIEEKSHRDKLTILKAEKKLSGIELKKVTDLKISDYMVEQKIHDDMDYQESLVVAMLKEKAAYKLYTDLAEIADNEELKKLFKYLAMEEAQHKLRFEIEYDDNVMQEN
ncbi:MAG: ferritin family protein [Bacteroidetes bacterium]|nr:ferritin family protein [Bacteroidota bacterium]